MSNDGVISIVGNQNATVVDGNSSVIIAGNGNDRLAAGANSLVIAGNGADAVSVGAGGLVLVGDGNDTVAAGANSIIAAGNGNDQVTAGAGSEIVVGNGNDSLSAGSNSVVVAGNGNDQVVVGANSVVVVGNGNDIIHLGQSDLVTVGNGKDTFIVPGSAQVTLTTPSSLSVKEDGSVTLALSVGASGFGFGREAIVGFSTSKDVIQLSTSQFANFAAVMAAAKQVGGDTIITADASNAIDLAGVRLSSLTASDFSFVSPTSNILVTISNIPADVTLSDTAGAITVVNGSVTLTAAQLTGLTLKAGEVTTANLTVTATDTSTGNSISKTIVLSVTPVAPTLTGPTSLTVGSGATIALGITETPFDPRDTISLTIKGVPTDASLSAGTKNADGSWTLTPAQLTGLTLKAGAATTATLTVTATNTAGATASTSETIQVSVTPPLKVTFDTVSFTDTGVQGDHITSNGSVTLSGTVTDSLTVSQVQVFNGSTLLGTATVDNVHHTWSLATTLGNGNYNQLKVTATDSGGNTATASTAQFVTVDTTPPVITGAASQTDEATSALGAVATFTATATDLVDGTDPVVFTEGGKSVHSGGIFSLGVHHIVETATDAAGNASTKTFDITVQDKTPPVITGAASQTDEATSALGAVATFTATATDLVDGTDPVVFTEGGNSVHSGGIFSLGVHHIVETATDAAGNASTKTFDITVQDKTPPVITGAASQTDEATSALGAVATFTATATDLVDGTDPVVFTEGGNSVHSGGIFSLGVHHIVETATDAAGNASTKTFDITVQDKTPPVITGAASQTDEATSALGAVATFTATATDLVDGTDPVVFTEGGNSVHSGGIFSLGVHHIVETATDAAGNASTKTFDITVQDKTPPVITGAASQTDEATSALGAVATFTATATDLVDGTDPVVFTEGGNSVHSGGIFSLGVHHIVETATDAAGNASTKTFDITVQDKTPPVITGAASQTDEATSALGAVATFTATATDLVDGTDPVVFTEGGNSVHSGGIFSLGVHHIVETATDAAGNASTKTFDITVQDKTPPVITGAASQTDEATSALGAVATFTATATDLVDGTDPVVFTEGGNSVHSGGIFSLGVHHIVETATDAAGNASTKTFDITVQDKTPPVITGAASQTDEATSALGAVATFTATATDLVDGTDPVVFTEGGNSVHSGGIFSLGVHHIVETATDAAGNASTKTFDITVQDKTPPVITGAASQTDEATSALGAVATFTATATDLVDGTDPVVFTEGGNSVHSGGIFSLGVHHIVETATDAAGNASTKTFDITVQDTTPPSVTFDSVSYDHTGTAGYTKDGNVTLSGTTSDNVTVSQVQVFNGTQLLGTATVDNTAHTWTLTQNLSAGVYSNLSATATDEAGNTSSAANTDTTQTLQIDHTPPSISFGTVSFVDTGVANDGITNNNQVTMSGATSDDVMTSQVQVFSGSHLLGNAVVDNNSHTWTLTTNLSDGTYANLTATATDEAGNSTSTTNTGATASFQIATAGPTVTFTNVTLTDPTNSAGTASSDGMITLSGAISDSVGITQVQVFNGTQSLGVASVSNGVWSLATTLAQGTYNNLHATATDVAGNVSDVSNSHVVTVSPESGYVIDGYISGAKVFADTNGNGKLDPGEASGITDSSGHFTLGAGTTAGTLVLIGGTDTATGLAFTGVMTAPTGSTQVTPLTTLVQSVAAANGGNVAAASQSVATALGLDPTVNLTNLDTVAAAYAGNTSAFVAASKVLNTVSMVASAVAGTGASDFSAAASSAFSAIASQIVATNAPIDLTSSSLVSTVVSSTIASASSGASSLTSGQTAAIASVVTSVNTATDNAVSTSTGGTAALLTNVSATSIVAQGSTSPALQQATSGATDLTTLATNTTVSNVTSSSNAAVSQVLSVAPAAPTFVSLTPTDGSPNNFSVVHYTLTFSAPITASTLTASDFSISATGLVGSSIGAITPVAGSNGTQFTIAVNTGVGDGTLTLSFNGSSVQDIAGNAFQDTSTHAGSTYIVDQDTGEQAALALKVTNTTVNTAGSATFNFTVAGLEPDDTGKVTFTDGTNQVTVAVNGGQTSYTANLSTLSDGPITSSLAVNTDAAGNSFTPVAGTSAVVLSGFNVTNGVHSNGGTIQDVQNGVGDITVAQTSSVSGQAGDGIQATDSVSGSGNISVTATGGVSASGTTSVMTGNPLTQTTQGYAAIRAQNLDTANNGNVSVSTSGTLNGSQFGIRAQTSGSGNVSVTTDATTVINAGGAGISAVNFDASMLAAANSTITVTAHGTINSGSMVNPNGSTPAGINVSYYASPVGTITTAPNANVNGTVLVTSDATINAAGYGIQANDWGNGNVTVNATGGNITSTGYGILAYNKEVGSVSISTAAGMTISSNGTGISASDQGVFAASNNATATVINYATVQSGAVANGATLAGILAGFNGGVSVANPNINGTVLIDNYGNVTAAKSWGIDAYNWGSGNVTVVEEANTSVTAGTATDAAVGIAAFGLGGNAASGPVATGDVSLTLKGNVTVTTVAPVGFNISQTGFGVEAASWDVGNVSVTTSAGDIINSASIGILALGEAKTIGAGHSVTVNAADGTTIHTGANFGINAGYVPLGSSTVSSTVHGDVFVTSGAVITSPSNGINAFNWGAGNVTVTTDAASNITSGNSGIGASTNNGGNVVVSNGGTATGTNNGINAFVASNLVNAGTISVTNSGTVSSTNGNGISANDQAGGNVSVTNTGSATGKTGINVNASGAGNIVVENDGQITATTFSGININQNSAGSIGSTTITNTGTVVGGPSHSAINVNENPTGTLTINNTGTIGAVATATSAPAVTVSPGATVIVNNNGQVDGNIYTNSTGGFTGTFNNNAGATWQTAFLDDEGNITTSGAGSAITVIGSSTGMAVGNTGTGNLTIAAGAALTAGFLNIGVSAGSHGTVTVKNGGTITTGFLSMSSQAGSAGNLTVDGAGSVVSASGIGFGSSGSSAALNVSNGGAVDIGSGTSTIAGAVHIGSTSLIGTGTINGNVVNDGNVTAVGLLDIAGILSGSGSININSGATLELGGSGAENVYFSGGNNTLQLDNAPGFTGTITGTSGSTGTFTITGQGNVTATSGDAIDFNSAGGAVGSQANVVVNTGGTIAGALNGISVVQNGVGDITVAPTGSVTGQAGDGVIAEQSTSGSGNITVNASGSLTGTGAGSIGLLAENLNAANSGNIAVTATGGTSGAFDGVDVVNQGNGNITIETAGAVASTTQFGIRAEEYGTGSISATTDAASSINSGGTGVSLVSFATSPTNSTLTVTANGTIHSGTTVNPSGSAPQGVAAGYYGASAVIVGTNGVPNTSVSGTVVINNNANITADAGYGIDGFDWGNGNVTVNDGTGTSVTGAQYGIAAYGLSKGTGDVAVNVATNATIAGNSIFGIQAFNADTGNVSVTTSAGDMITSGSSGINAQSQASSDSSSSSVTVIANGIIHSGTLLTPNGSTPSGIAAGYSPGGINTASSSVAGNVVVQSNATIVAAAGIGINGYNFGTGNVTVTTGVTSSITAAGNSISAGTGGGGSVSVTNAGSASGGGSGINVYALSNPVGIGAVSVNNSGTVTGTSGSGINAGDQSGGNVSVTNTGSATGKTGINVNASGTGNIIVDNSGQAIGTSFSGINANASGTGNVTVTTEAASNVTTTGSTSTAIYAGANNGGNVSVTNGGTVSGATGLTAAANGAGSIFVENDGHITTTAFVAVNVTQNSAGSTGSATIVNTGTLLASGLHSAINVNENATGVVTINNSGTIGPMVLDSTFAIFENGGDVSLTNTGQINGAIQIANGTFNNQSGGTWQANGSSNFGFGSSTGVVESNTINNAGTINLTGGASLGAPNGLVLNNTGTLNNVSGVSTINGTVANTGTIEVKGGTLDLAGGLSGAGAVVIDNGATLELAGSGAESVTFSGGSGTLQLDNIPGFTGTIAGTATNSGTFTITGAGNVTATSGDAIDFTSSVGSSGNPATIVLTPSGNLTGAAAGLVATQNGVGDITVNTSGAVSGQAGDGIQATDSASGSGNISVTATGGVSASGTTSVMTGNPLTQTTQGYAAIRAQNLDTANNGNVSVSTSGTLNGSQFGIRAQTSGSGNVSVTTDATTVINAGGAGISAVNFDASMLAAANSTITVTAHGTINSGSMVNPNGSTPAGINVSYYASPVGTITTAPNANVNGTVLVTSDATINAAGYGIQANDWGNGNVTVNATGGNITSTGYGILAYNKEVGSVSISTAAGMTISSNGTGISASDQGVFAASNNATATVINYATVQSGAVANGATLAGILAGFNGGVSVANPNINGTVLIDNYGNVTAAKSWGIDAYNWGSGNVTVVEEANTSVTAGTATDAAVGIAAFGLGGNAASGPVATGDVSLTLKGNVTVTTVAPVGFNISQTGFGVEAASWDVGNVSVTTSAGDIINSASIGILALGEAKTIGAGHSVTVNAADGTTIHTGANFGINAGYVPLGSSTVSSTVHGDVFVTSGAVITSPSNGINAFNWGAGNVTVTTDAASNITSGNSGIGASTNNGGNVVVSNGGTATGTNNGINAFVASNLVNAGTISVTNSGTASSTNGNGISANDQAGGNVSVTNTGSATGKTGINVNASGAGNIVVDNSGQAIAASFSGINANASGTGNVTVTTEATSNVTTTGSNSSAINANANGGNVSVTNGGSASGSTGLSAGTTAAGSIFIENDGHISAATTAINAVQTSPGTTGSATIVNTGTLLASGLHSAINVNENATGVVTINNSGTIGPTVLDSTFAIFENGGDVSLTNTGQINGAIQVANGTFNNQSGGTWQANGNSNFGFGSSTGVVESNTINNAGTINLTGGASLGAPNGLVLNNTGTLNNVSGVSTINGTVANTGTIEVKGGTLDLAGGLSGAGAVVIDNGATLELAGSGAESVTFSGGSGTLQLDNIPGFTGTIAGTATNSGNFTITGAGNVTASSGDAIDFTSSGGAAGTPANVILTSGGTLTGALNGINVVQNGIGDITLDPSGSVVGQSGDGVIAEQSATGVGNIVINASGSLTGSGAGAIGLFAENLDTASSGNITITASGGVTGNQHGIRAVQNGSGNIAIETAGTVTSTVQFGIRAEDTGAGSIAVVTDVGSSINSGGSGINALNQATAISQLANSQITVTNNAAVTSGTTPNPSGSQAIGIVAGYYGANATANTAINGTVLINNNANVTAAAGYGVQGYTYGNGNVTVNDAAGTTVSGLQYGVAAYQNSKGSGNVAVNVGANATVKTTGTVQGNAFFAIQAFSNAAGNVSVTTADGDTITAASIAVNAQSQAASDPATSSVSVVLGKDTIHSGSLLSPGNSLPGAVSAGYQPNGSNTANNNVAGNVSVQSNATITADKGAGINAYNWGTGNVTVTTGTSSSITALTPITIGSTTTQANGINANALNGGNLSVTNAGSINAATGINASANKTGSITIENDGQITAATFSGINATQNAGGATGSTTITNTGTVVGAAGHSSINVNENAAGTVTINNTGTIGALATATTAPAVTVNGALAVIVNNNGQIDGNIYTNSTGGFTGTLNNNAGAIWQTGFLDDEGTITASGAGSAITIVGSSTGMVVGNTGTGNLTIAADAALTAAFLNIASSAGSHGTVTVTGVGTTVNAGANVGDGIDGTASLTIANHAVMTSTNMDVATHHDVGVTDTLDVNNAALNVGQSLTIGDAGTAHATVENGGTITAGSLTIANQPGSSGSLTVDGAGSVVTATSGLTMGYSGGAATLSVTHGGAIDIGSDAITISGAIHVGSADSIQATGTINGNLVNDGNITAVGASATGAVLDVTGAVTGAGSFHVAAAGHLEFGSSVAASDTVVFQSSTGSLVLDQSSSFAGTISGFTGDGTLSGSDQIDLKDISFGSGLGGSLSATFDPVQDRLLVSDGTHSTTLQFVGSYVLQNFKFASDGNGGTIVYDPPVSTQGSNTGTSNTAAGVSNWAGNGDGFKFADIGHTTTPNQDSEHFATATAPLPTADPGIGAGGATFESHDQFAPAGIADAALSFTHFHLV